MPNTNPVDLAIAGFINKDLKQCASTSAMSACECTTPELRQIFTTISQESIRRQEKLANMMSQKGWYVAPQADQATINTLMPQLQAATQGLGTNTGPTGNSPSANITDPGI